MLELTLAMTAEEALAACRARGLIVTGERPLASGLGGRHWHLRFPDRPGTLELSEAAERVWVKVHPQREGDWAPQLARELSVQRPASP